MHACSSEGSALQCIRMSLIFQIELYQKYLILITSCKNSQILINHTHSSPIREIIGLAIVKIGRGKAESVFDDCVCNSYHIP